MPLDPRILSSQTLGPLSPAGGVNLQPDAALRDSLWIGEQESPRSENWWHIRGNLIYRDELTDHIPDAAKPATNDIINGLFNIRFEDGTNYLAIHTGHPSAPKFFAWNGGSSVASILDRTPAAAMLGGPESPWATAQVLNRYFFCNGRGELCVWPDDPVSPNTTNPALAVVSVSGYTGPTSLIGRYLTAFAGRIIMGYTVETGQTKAQRLRWCSDGRYANWDTAAGLGAGAVDLSDTPGRITGLMSSYDQLTIFKEDAIILGRESGDPRAPIVFPNWLKIGCSAGSSAQPIDPQSIIFLGNDGNIYLLRGGVASPIGDKVRQAITTTINITHFRQIVSWTRPDLSLYFLAIPRLGETYPKYAFVYNWAEDKWWSDIYQTEIHSAALSDVGATLTWDDAIGAWEDIVAPNTAAFTWEQLTPVATRMSPVFGVPFDPTTWRVHRYQPPSQGIDLSASPTGIPCVWQTKDIRLYPDGRSVLTGFYVDIEADSGNSGILTLDIFTDRSASPALTLSRTFNGPRERITFFPIRTSAKLTSLRLSTSYAIPIHIRAVEPIVMVRPSGFPILRGPTP